MGQLFSTESRFYAALTAATDLVLLNIALLFVCLPVVTVGAAGRSATVVIKQMQDDEGSSRVRVFFRELRRNWQTPTLWWIISLVIGTFCAYELYVISRADLGTVGIVASAGVLSGLLIIASIGLWLQTICAIGPLAEKPASFGHTVAQALTMAVRHLPRTALALMACAIIPTAAIALPGHWAALSAYCVIIGPALAMYLAVAAIAPALANPGHR